MSKLCQIIAIANGRKTSAQKTLTEIYHKLQKPELFVGLSRTYAPLSEDGETVPPESKLNQYNVNTAIADAEKTLIDLIDVVSTQDNANCSARANVVVDGNALLTQVPVTTLLFLEKQLTDISTFITKLPVLDPAEEWSFNQAKDCYVTAPTKTNKSKKVPRAFEKSPATKEHPAQVDVFTEDIKIGEYTLTKFSGCVPASQRNEFLERVGKLQDAIKFAREEANTTEVIDVKNGEKMLKFIFG